MAVVLVCVAISGFFVANVFATAPPGGLTVTVPTVTVSVPTVTVSVPAVTATTPAVTATTPVVTATVPAVTATTPVVTATTPAVTATVPAVTATVPAVTAAVPGTTVTATTPVATASVTTPSSGRDVGTLAQDAAPTAVRSSGQAPTGAAKTRGERGPTAPASRGSTSAPVQGTVLEGHSTESGSRVSGTAATRVVRSRAGKRAALLGAFRIDRLRGSRRAVGLRLVLSHAARVRFLVIGPAPSCRVAGRFVVAGHRGLNKVPFRGRVRGKLLGPGVYTIVRQPAAGSRQRPKAVALSIDARGIRPTAPVRWRNCDSAAPASSSGPRAGDAGPAPVLRASGIAAAEAIAPAKNKRPAAKRLPAVLGWFPTVPTSPQLSAFLLALLAVSIALLMVAAVEPGYMLRFRTVRMIAGYRGQIAGLGAALLVTTILLFLL